MKPPSFFYRLLSFFFPAECLRCSREDFWICPACQPFLRGGERCENPSFVKYLYVFGDYHNTLLQKAIVRLKFGFSLDVLQDLEPFFQENLARIPLPEEALFCPVPLHFWRKNKRGFNQSLEIAQVFSEITGRGVSEMLVRHKGGDPQSWLSKEDRKTHVQDAFSLQKKSLLPSRKMPIILVDDVMATGSTLRACAVTLRKAGFQNIWAIVVAKSIDEKSGKI